MVSVRTSKQILTIYYLLTIHLVLMGLLADKALKFEEVEGTEDEIRVEVQPTSGPTAAPTVTLAPSPPESDTGLIVPSRPDGLIVPVAGVSREQLMDSFADARGEGRVHDAIDIPAAAGTPVLAAADGRIIKFFESEAGGTTIYQLDSSGRYVFYYAHLQRRADDLKVDDEVKQGQTIAYVGDTGNAGPGNYHLHFSVMIVTDPKRYSEGEYINPYPLLMR